MCVRYRHRGRCIGAKWMGMRVGTDTGSTAKAGSKAKAESTGKVGVGKDGGEKGGMEKNAGRGAVRHVDSYDLVLSGARISGSVPLLALSRFLAGLPEQADTLVDWSVVGEKNASGQAFLTVRVAARPLLECQCCLEPFEWPIDARDRKSTRLNSSH